MKRMANFWMIGMILSVLLSGYATNANSEEIKNKDSSEVQEAKCVMVLDGNVTPQLLVNLFNTTGRYVKVFTRCKTGKDIGLFMLDILGTKQDHTLVIFSKYPHQLNNVSPTDTHGFVTDFNDLPICQILIHGQPVMCAETMIYLSH